MVGRVFIMKLVPWKKEIVREDDCLYSRHGGGSGSRSLYIVVAVIIAKVVYKN